MECPTCEIALHEIQNGAGAVIIAEEVLNPENIQRLARVIKEQSPWSDFPLILLTLQGQVTVQSMYRNQQRQPLLVALQLERPVRPETLISTVEVALRARRRQYELRDQLEAQKHAEEALRRSEKLAVAGRLMAAIAHEINNPLEAIINLVYLARTAASHQTAREYLAGAEAELARITAITTETLKFYRQQNKATSVRIDEIFQSLLVLYREKIASAKVDMKIDFRDVPELVAYGGELRQAFANLLSNAIDASAGAQIRIRIHRARNGAGKHGLRVVVADRGTGIPEQVKATMFEPFVTTKGARGTGLGLWITSEIIRKHSGTIRVKSSTDPARHGTVFTVFLPVAAQNLETMPAKEPSQARALTG